MWLDGVLINKTARFTFEPPSTKAIRPPGTLSHVKVWLMTPMSVIFGV